MLLYFTFSATTISDFKITEVTNETLRLEWTSTADGELFSIGLENTNSANESQNLSTKAEAESDKCTIQVHILMTCFKINWVCPEHNLLGERT